ncbi:hypothetical protein VKS41_008277 [Umbelopsis sp. WA50703]
MLQLAHKSGAFTRVLPRIASLIPTRHYAIVPPVTPGPEAAGFQVFHRDTKRKQKDRAAINVTESRVTDYLKDEIAARVADRILDIKRNFNTVVDLGSGCGHIVKHLDSDMVDKLIMCDMSGMDLIAFVKMAMTAETLVLNAINLEQALNRDKDIQYDVEVERKVVDEELLPFEENSLEAVVSSLSMHWVNDLPGALIQIRRSLKPDGVFVGAMFGGDTLFELRTSLQLAELEREGGISPRVSPLTDSKDMSNLLTRAGFTLTTVDVDEIQVNYPSAIELMQDLRSMGESNAVINR